MLWAHLYVRALLQLKVVFMFKIKFGHLSISLNFEYDPISGCWDIPLLIFWGSLSLEIIFILRICKILFSHLSLSLNFENYTINGFWNIPLLIFWGHLPLEVIFFGLRSSSFKYILELTRYWLRYFPLSYVWGCLPYCQNELTYTFLSWSGL
jgi:hypothetical protein